tara:strand:+ start:649 stop:984 length:336 start_codon:yes stop_codon:yes gene_type:complete
MMFKATGAGFHITFDNGWTISVQWGPGTNSDNRMKSYGTLLLGMKSEEAEVFAWNEDDIWWNFGTHKPARKGDCTMPYVKPDELIGYMHQISSITMSRDEAQLLQQMYHSK